MANSAISLREVRMQIKEIRGTFSMCYEMLLTYKKLGVKELNILPTKSDALKLADEIATKMGVGELRKVEHTDKNGNKTVIEYRTKWSPDLILRYFVKEFNNSVEIKNKVTLAKAKKAEKPAKAAKKAA